MSFTHCCTCGKDLKDHQVYSDGGGLEVLHGGGQCQECYGKDHPMCRKCEALLSPQFRFCPWCGKGVG